MHTPLAVFLLLLVAAARRLSCADALAALAQDAHLACALGCPIAPLHLNPLYESL